MRKSQLLKILKFTDSYFIKKKQRLNNQTQKLHVCDNENICCLHSHILSFWNLICYFKKHASF